MALPTRLGELPDQFPIFPLSGALLLPNGRLPLNIFEPRYLAMVEDALAAGRHIGMIQPNPAAPRSNAGPALHRVGCLGRLTSFAETEDGRYLVTLSGVIRFAVAEELPITRGYRRVEADFAPFSDDLAPETPEGLDRDAILTLLRSYFAHQGVEANWAALEQMSDNTLVGTLAMACPFAPLEKQALLEAPDFTHRSATLMALLQIDSHAGPGPQADQRPS
jgi:Lon protease-like protein